MKTERQSIFITNGEQRAALALVRSLGGAGYHVHVGSDSGHSLAGASRYCASEVALPDSLAAPSQFAQRVFAEATRLGATVILPVTEAALLAILPLRSEFAGTIPFASLESFRAISDKHHVLSAARDVGIAVPEQSVARSLDDVRGFADSIAYPVVLKPARSVGEIAGARTRLGVRYASSPVQLLREAAALGSAAYPLLLQQRVVGPGIGIFMLLWEGREVARFAHRRIREKPPSGGVSVYRESAPDNAELSRLSRALLDDFNWQGVAMIEYKVDAATGTPYLMEINGRFWGSLQLAIDAGVDFPDLLLRAARGEHPQPVTSWQTGVRSRWWWGDVDQLVTRLARSNAALALPPDSPGKLRALGSFLALWRPGDRNEILRVNDPLPFARETADWFTSLFRR